MQADFSTRIDNILERTNFKSPFKLIGKVVESHGLAYKVYLPNSSIGSCVEFLCDNGERSLGEVVGLAEDYCFVMPYDDLTQVNKNTKVTIKSNTSHILVSDELLGRVVDCNANPIDDLGEISKDGILNKSIYCKPSNPMSRDVIDLQLSTGVRSIDSFLSVGRGQRIAIMAGSGVGKSVLMGMMAKQTDADVNVIALIGERGREVLEFIKHDLGPEGLKKTVLVVATSDTSALMRIKAAYTATSIAEYFSDQGKNVFLMVDSLTRFAMAMREVGMSVGEPPGPKGYGASVFAKLPKLMERAGSFKNKGTITGIYTVLVEGGDFDEPVSDSVRSISDGHIVLSRDLAAKGHYPAIDVLQSISRVMTKVVKKEHQVVANYLKDLMSAYQESEDLINMGAYVPGANARVDKSIAIIDDLKTFLKQSLDDEYDPDDVFDHMVDIARKAEQSINPELFNDDKEV